MAKAKWKAVKWKRTEKMQDGCEISANIPALLLDSSDTELYNNEIMRYGWHDYVQSTAIRTNTYSLQHN